MFLLTEKSYEPAKILKRGKNDQKIKNEINTSTFSEN